MKDVEYGGAAVCAPILFASSYLFETVINWPNAEMAAWPMACKAP
jgi:hypothetical protein